MPGQPCDRSTLVQARDDEVVVSLNVQAGAYFGTYWTRSSLCLASASLWCFDPRMAM